MCRPSPFVVSDRSFGAYVPGAAVQSGYMNFTQHRSLQPLAMPKNSAATPRCKTSTVTLTCCCCATLYHSLYLSKINKVILNRKKHGITFLKLKERMESGTVESSEPSETQI